VRFSVLGLVSLSDGVETVVLPPSKSTSLLTALLLRPNQVVSSEYLQSVVWESSPPLTAKATLQTYILRLRRLFRDLGHVGSVIETVPGGYRFPATAANLDLVEFRHLVAQASCAADPDTELALLHQALQLWQGQPLGNIRSEPLRRDDLPWLTEEWLRAAERRFDLELELGRHREVTTELRAAVREHPGYERFWEQLVESLYRSGRQADALSEYANVKHYLRDELGIDPGPGLQQLELAILRGEQLAARGPVTPAQVPAEDPGSRFPGRTAEVEALRSWLVEALQAMARASGAELSASDIGHRLAEPPDRAEEIAEEILRELLGASLLEIGPGGGDRLYPLLRNFAATGRTTGSKSIEEGQ
jgi:DNA-binding SARP family transcriptional activator